MSDFLSNLIARSFAGQPAVQPRLPSLFESAAAEPFAETQSSAPAAATAQASPPVIPSVPKLFATDQPAMEKTVANTTAGSPAEKPPAHPNKPATPREPATILPPRLSDDMAVEIDKKKTVVPINAAPGEKNPGHAAPPHSFQKPSGRHAFQSRQQNSFSPVEPRLSAPAIHVTIGRVEVRAIQPAAPAPRPSKPAPPKLSLDDYLQKRAGGSR